MHSNHIKCVQCQKTGLIVFSYSASSLQDTLKKIRESGWIAYEELILKKNPKKLTMHIHILCSKECREQFLANKDKTNA